MAEIRPFSNGCWVCACVSGVCAAGVGRLGRGKCTGKGPVSGSDRGSSRACCFFCNLEEDVTLLSLFVNKPSPLLLEFN